MTPQADESRRFLPPELRDFIAYLLATAVATEPELTAEWFGILAEIRQMGLVPRETKPRSIPEQRRADARSMDLPTYRDHYHPGIPLTGDVYHRIYAEWQRARRLRISHGRNHPGGRNVTAKGTAR